MPNGRNIARLAFYSRRTESYVFWAGLLLNAVLGWWWADPVAGLPIVFRSTPKEGIERLLGKA
jgi:hypothetical protein